MTLRRPGANVRVSPASPASSVTNGRRMAELCCSRSAASSIFILCRVRPTRPCASCRPAVIFLIRRFRPKAAMSPLSRDKTSRSSISPATKRAYSPATAVARFTTARRNLSPRRKWTAARATGGHRMIPPSHSSVTTKRRFRWSSVPRCMPITPSHRATISGCRRAQCHGQARRGFTHGRRGALH